MLKLLRKDAIFNARALAFAYLLWSALWLGYPTARPDGEGTFTSWAVLVSLMCAFLPIMTVAREDKFKTGALACSLPVARDTIVASKYVGGWLLALAGVAVAVSIMWPLQAAGLAQLSAPTPGLAVGVVAVVGLLLAAFLPFTLRYGVMGLLGFLVAAQLLGIVVLLASSMFGGVGIRGGLRAVAGAVGWVRGALGTGGFALAVVAAVGAVNAVSYTVSKRIFRRREF